MENSKSILERAFEVNSAGGDGMAVLEELTQKEIGAALNELANRHHGRDLPLLVAAVKSTLPHWERVLGENGRELSEQIRAAMMSVDVAAIRAFTDENK